MSDKIFNFALSDEKDATLRYPNNLEFSLSEQQGIVGYGLQKAIIEGLTRVTKRVWPCLYCGNRTFGSQSALIKHFEANHLEGQKRIEQWLKDQPNAPLSNLEGDLGSSHMQGTPKAQGHEADNLSAESAGKE